MDFNVDTLPEFPDFKPFSSQPAKVTESFAHILPMETPVDPGMVERVAADTTQLQILTKEKYYTTASPLYGVQVGAFKEVIPVSRFGDLKNVDAFMDKEGLIRYVVGHFGIHSQAESLLKIIREQGYPDAFVVNVNNERKFTEEVVSVNNINIRARGKTTIRYKTQLGAFKDNLSPKTAEIYLKIEGVKEQREGEYTYLITGNFSTYEEAKAYTDGIKASGHEDAFVIAVNNGRKISLEQARNFNFN
jgi:hypothetical protein